MMKFFKEFYFNRPHVVSHMMIYLIVMIKHFTDNMVADLNKDTFLSLQSEQNKN
jgi:hypothetical protein